MPDAAGCGIIWDMDGTLVDTAELHFAAWAAVCRENDRAFTRAEFAATFGRRNPEIVHYLFRDRFGEADVARLGDRKEVLYRAAATKGVELLPGVRPLLEGLHQAGAKQGIGSSAPRANLQLTGIAPLLDAVVSMEDTDRGKPDPQVFLVAAQKLGVPPSRCVVVEDAVAGVQAAKAGGMKCIAVRFVGHHLEAKLREAGADRVVKSLQEITVADVLALVGVDERRGLSLPAPRRDKPGGSL
jgi:beta-phosphoglucomutase